MLNERDPRGARYRTAGLAVRVAACVAASIPGTEKKEDERDREARTVGIEERWTRFEGSEAPRSRVARRE